jgi:hypothetical protein
VESNPYQGINLALAGPDGARMELQLHIAKSLAVKEGEMHKLYEQHRVLSERDPHRESLAREMLEAARAVPVPNGAVDVR